MSLLDDPEEFGPDPQMVCQLTDALTESLTNACLPGVTSQADVLSALFTVLARALQAARDHEAPEDAQRNATEIGRILGILLMEYGAETLQ